MTNPTPYTAEEVVEVTRKLLDAAEVVDESGETGFDGADDLPDLARLAATLREYERVLKEQAKWIQAVGLASTCAPDMVIDTNDPVGMMERVCAEFAALRPDAERWRAVRDDLAIDQDSTLPDGNPLWRIVGNNYDYYSGPVPATVDEAADILAARAAGEG